MSWAKRLIDIECQRIANETGYSWDEVMDAATSVDFDMEFVNVLAHMYCLDSFNRKRVKAVIRGVYEL